MSEPSHTVPVEAASFGRDDVEILGREILYDGYFRIVRVTLRHRAMDGGWTEPFSREIFERGIASAVLPYDPVRDEVVLIEQFRAGGLYGAASPWMIEIVAGIIDAGETPEMVARREAVEEAGLEVGRIEAISVYQPSPGACDEWVHLYVGEVAAGTRADRAGLAEENEDIKVFALSRADAVALLDGDRLDNATTIVALNWLARHGEALRRRWLATKTEDEA
ncbi:NUDIX domain-containing protein [Tistrella bauzanensis]|uniref:ADP-ribose pyrophosphatase n=1 Tax=Tistrella arctica TaxID=3133430 RepID=A0ABU9YR42_9PROT